MNLNHTFIATLPTLEIMVTLGCSNPNWRRLKAGGYEQAQGQSWSPANSGDIPSLTELGSLCKTGSFFEVFWTHSPCRKEGCSYGLEGFICVWVFILKKSNSCFLSFIKSESFFNNTILKYHPEKIRTTFSYNKW